MRKLILLAIVIGISGQVLAIEPAPLETGKATATKTEKRRKKVAMCPTCGKPESKCDCLGEKKGKHEEHQTHSKTDQPEKKLQ